MCNAHRKGRNISPTHGPVISPYSPHSSPVKLMQLKNYHRSCYHRSGFRLYHPLNHLLSPVLISRRNQLRNSKWVSFLGAVHSQAQPFWKIARYFTTLTRSVPPLFDLGVQVSISAGKAELLAQHFERILHLNLNVGTANHTHLLNRTVNKYFRRSHSHLPETQLINPYELLRLIQYFKTESALGTEGISITMLRNLSRISLIHLTNFLIIICSLDISPTPENPPRLSPA